MNECDIFNSEQTDRHKYTQLCFAKLHKTTEKLDREIFSLNYRFLTSGLVHYDHLEESIPNSRGFWWMFPF